jgi:hypothetical protein
MRIKLSKNQWELVGEKAGWIKKSSFEARQEYMNTLTDLGITASDGQVLNEQQAQELNSKLADLYNRYPDFTERDTLLPVREGNRWILKPDQK